MRWLAFGLLLYLAFELNKLCDGYCLAAEPHGPEIPGSSPGMTPVEASP